LLLNVNNSDQNNILNTFDKTDVHSTKFEIKFSPETQNLSVMLRNSCLHTFMLQPCIFAKCTVYHKTVNIQTIEVGVLHAIQTDISLLLR